MLITEPYRAQQAALHAKGGYGTAGTIYAKQVAKVIDSNNVQKLLDYGSGSQLSLIRAISEERLVSRAFDYVPFDPAVPQYSEAPLPAEMVVCVDVLEHIEPDCLEGVLNDLKRVTERIGFFAVSTIPAAKTLPDGRNAHLIQESPEWWLPKITDRFTLQTFQRTASGFIVLVSPQ